MFPLIQSSLPPACTIAGCGRYLLRQDGAVRRAPGHRVETGRQLLAFPDADLQRAERRHRDLVDVFPAIDPWPGLALNAIAARRGSSGTFHGHETFGPHRDEGLVADPRRHGAGPLSAQLERPDGGDDLELFT